MKIAFCISGHLRNFIKLKDNYLEFKNFIEQFGQVDTFVSTWNHRNTDNSWSNQHNLNEQNSSLDTITYDIVKKHYDTNYIKILNYDFYDSNFSPLRYENFTTRTYNWNPDPSLGSGKFGIHNNIVHSTKMFFLIYESNILKSYEEFINNQEYNWVFRIRPDMHFFHQQYSKQILLDKIDSTKLYIHDGHIFGDQFAYGSSKLMNKYASAFMRISSANDKDIFGDPETVMHTCLSGLIGESNIIRIPKCGYILAENPNSHIVYR